jgi:hypothetical protein
LSGIGATFEALIEAAAVMLELRSILAQGTAEHTTCQRHSKYSQVVKQKYKIHQAVQP